MTKTGPQKYTGASTAHWYQKAYPGDAMEVNVVVLHTTEGRTLPDYGGGATAPNLTAVPDVAARKLVWYQHFDIDVSSRALVNLAGGVQTNTLNVCQVELVGTCDPATHAKWGSAAHIYWPQAPDWALAEVARFLAWMNAQHGVPLSGPTKWPAYPASYGTSNGARMSNATWTDFSGVCGHLHVPENLHGDPGAIDFARLIALAKGTTEEDDMALTTDDIGKVATAVAAKLIAGGGVLETSDVDRVTAAVAAAFTAGETAQTAAIQAALAKLPVTVALTDAQIQALAGSPALAEAIAERVAVKLAARLAS
jgi:hypothetical protein